MMDRVAFALCLALLFVWSIPGTIALRSLLLVTALVSLVTAVPAGAWRKQLRLREPWLVVFLLLTIWLLVQPLLISTDTARVLAELKGQWLPAAVALAVGFGLGTLTLRATPLLHTTTAIALVLAAQAAIAVAHSLWHGWQHGALLRQVVPLTGGKLEMSFVLNLLLAFLTVDLFCRATQRAPLLRLPLRGVLALVSLALFCAYLAGARNGVIAIAFLSFSAISLFVFDQRRRLGLPRTAAAALAIVLALAAFGYASVLADPRWRDFRESAALALTVQPGQFPEPGSPQWPRLADGRPADPSALTRVAFINMGLDLIAAQPLGRGYGRNAFGHALREDLGAGRGHAHSGWIDLGVGGGIPALALWAAFLGALMLRGLSAFFARGDAHGLLLFLLATGYAGRMVLDSVNKDHMLQMFLFLAGLLLVLTAPRRSEAAP